MNGHQNSIQGLTDIVYTAQQDGPVCIMKWGDKENMTMISPYHSAESRP
jgi:hypothetical protein